MTIFDAFFHSSEEGWTCSVLTLPARPPAKAALAPEKIRTLATESLRNGTIETATDADKAVLMRMAYVSQELILIPVGADSNGKVMHAEIWAVNFRDPSRKARPDELFTVWVTVAGDTADIRRLDL